MTDVDELFLQPRLEPPVRRRFERKDEAPVGAAHAHHASRAAPAYARLPYPVGKGRPAAPTRDDDIAAHERPHIFAAHAAAVPRAEGHARAEPYAAGGTEAAGRLNNKGYARWQFWEAQCQAEGIRFEDCTGALLGKEWEESEGEYEYEYEGAEQEQVQVQEFEWTPSLLRELQGALNELRVSFPEAFAATALQP